MLSSSCRIMDTEMVSLRTSNCSVILKDGGWYAEPPSEKARILKKNKTKKHKNVESFCSVSQESH